MGEPSVDWEMQEGYPPEENSGKVNWILKKGLVLGKKILVTGVVVTSASVVLPPLLVISAFGLAVSIPSGLFLAGYACSEKLMSRLLPGPSPYTFPLDCGGTSYSEEIEEDGIGSEVDTEMEKEQEQIEDTGVAVARRFQLPVSGVEIGLEKVGSDLVLHDVSEIMEEGREENILEHMDKQINPDMEANIRGMSEEIRDIPINEMQGIVLTIEADDRAGLDNKGTPFEVRNVVVMESAGVEEIKEGELAGETTVLIEKLRDKGKDDRRELHRVVNDEDEQEHERAVDKNTKDVGTLVEAKDAGRKSKRKGKRKGKVEEKRAKELLKQNEKSKEFESSVGDTAEAGRKMKEQSPADSLGEEEKRSAKDATISALRTSEGNQATDTDVWNRSLFALTADG